MALAYLVETFGPELRGAPQAFLDRFDPERLALLRSVIEKRVNCPLTSSMGRLFDAVSALSGVCTRATFEGQPAMELEGIAASSRERYDFDVDPQNVVDWRGIIRGVAEDVARGLSPRLISAKFHGTLGDMILAVCERLREQEGLSDIVLSGGVFQNARLLRRAFALLSRAGFRAHFPQSVPANDGGIALGQAVVALHRKHPRYVE